MTLSRPNRGKAILDIGVGTGRTIPILKPLASHYQALDYLPQMVAASRRNYPNTDIKVGDARSLDGYPDAYFGLVNFSLQRLDAVSTDDRKKVFRAVRPRPKARRHFLFFDP